MVDLDLAISSLRACQKYNTEHDLDCEEGMSDRCPVCLVNDALAHLSAMTQ
jgi:hypothetical protein